MKLRTEKTTAAVPVPSIEPTEAICISGFRVSATAQMVERWSRLSVDHELVRNHPEFWRGLVPLTTEEVTDRG